MFIVKSLRRSGVLVEIVRGGQPVWQRIGGLGSTSSENLTEDMKTQKDFGYIDYSLKDASLTDSELASALGEQDKLGPQYLSKSDLSSMLKDELINLAVEYDVAIREKALKSDFVEALVKEKIPKR